MSGHNKWSTIKNKKAKTDASKGKIFTKIGREIVIAVKTGGSADPAGPGHQRADGRGHERPRPAAGCCSR